MNEVELLQARIAALQGTNAPASTGSSEVKELIRQVIREEIGSSKDTTVVKPEPAPQPVKELSLLESIGKCISEEEQIWLSNTEVLKASVPALSKYFQTETGTAAVRSFVKYFRGSYET